MPASYSRSVLFYYCRLAPTFQALKQENSLEKSKPGLVLLFVCLFLPQSAWASQTPGQVVSNNSCIFNEHPVTKAMTLQKSCRHVQIVWYIWWKKRGCE